jgi:hypothetical protein
VGGWELNCPCTVTCLKIFRSQENSSFKTSLET